MAKNTTCTIVMYHYVRDLKKTRYPEIKGLDLSLFYEQLAFLEKHYHFITIEELIDAQKNNDSLPPKSVLLTFDDGYAEHYQHAFPILNRKKIQGCFYIPAATIINNTVLDVNKIHFILAAVQDKNMLIQAIYAMLKEYRSEYQLESNEYYFEKLAVANRFDTKEVIFIKRLLQVELKETLRNIMADRLFKQFVSSDERAFSAELYMNAEQIECMQRNGMHIGGHGYNHYWLASLSAEAQGIEINKSKEFIASVGGNLDYWTFCYPYGNHNNDTLTALQNADCKLAMTASPDIADFSKHGVYTLPRLDTNDLPKNQQEPVNKWYELG